MNTKRVLNKIFSRKIAALGSALYLALCPFPLLSENDAQTQFQQAGSYFDRGDYNEGFKWLKSAAEQGSAPAQYKLGIGYLNGKFIKQDRAQAVKWLQKAAEQNEANAQFELAICYLKGRGVTKDYNKCLNWLTKAALQGHQEARSVINDLAASLNKKN
jgi:TPR repeat protein